MAAPKAASRTCRDATRASCRSKGGGGSSPGGAPPVPREALRAARGGIGRPPGDRLPTGRSGHTPACVVPAELPYHFGQAAVRDAKGRISTAAGRGREEGGRSYGPASVVAAIRQTPSSLRPAGNLAEWCPGLVSAPRYYSRSPREDPPGPSRSNVAHPPRRGLGDQLGRCRTSRRRIQVRSGQRSTYAMVVCVGAAVVWRAHTAPETAVALRDAASEPPRIRRSSRPPSAGGWAASDFALGPAAAVQSRAQRDDDRTSFRRRPAPRLDQLSCLLSACPTMIRLAIVSTNLRPRLRNQLLAPPPLRERCCAPLLLDHLA